MPRSSRADVDQGLPTDRGVACGVAVPRPFETLTAVSRTEDHLVR